MTVSLYIIYIYKITENKVTDNIKYETEGKNLYRVPWIEIV